MTANINLIENKMPCSYDAYKINKYFADTVYLVEADSYSQLALCAENDKRESKYKCYFG